MNQPADRFRILLAAVLAATAAACSVRDDEPAAGPAATEPAAEEPDGTGRAYEPIRLADAPYQGDLKPFVVSARASSSDSDTHSPELAFDGNPSTRWSSTFQDGQWIECWFDREVKVSEVRIRWETARASDFSIQLAGRATNWVEVGRRGGAVGTEDLLSFEHPVPAIAIRVQCDRRATEWGNSIVEVDLQGTTMGTPPDASLLHFKVKPNDWQAREREIAAKLLAEAAADPLTSAGLTDDQFLDLVEKRSFYYFWYESNPSNGLTKDRGRNFDSSEEASIASVAAVGYALTACAIGAERGWVTREEAVERTRTTLRTFTEGIVRNVNGFFPHFVSHYTGQDTPGTEISTIDTALFLAGAITAMEYFNDEEVTRLTTRLFEQADWNWARDGNPTFVVHGLDTAGNFLGTAWSSMTEGLLIYLLALGSPTHPLPRSAWDAIDRHTGDYAGYNFVIEFGGQSIFRYQYPTLWYDFRGRTDRAGMDYFENATLAVLAMRQYCIDQAAVFPFSYGPDSWGLGAADGPGDQYMIYGFPPGDPYSPTDGTVIPYAIAGSVPFLPQHTIRALRSLYDNHHEMWGKYGFADSVNPEQSFVARDAIGLDAGTICIGIENYRSRMVWNLFMQNPWIRKTTQEIGWKTRPRSQDPGGPIDLARDHRWRFATGGGILASPSLDDSPWKTVVVPEYWENIAPEMKGYDGVGWYRVAFELDAERIALWVGSGRPISLRIGAIDDEDVAYVNGIQVGETKGGADVARRPRRYNVQPGLLRAGRNVIAVQVTDRSGLGGIWRTPVELGPE